MSDAMREMSLDEMVAHLSPNHRARVELDALRENAPAAEQQANRVETFKTFLRVRDEAWKERDDWRACAEAAKEALAEAHNDTVRAAELSAKVDRQRAELAKLNRSRDSLRRDRDAWRAESDKWRRQAQTTVTVGEWKATSDQDRIDKLDHMGRIAFRQRDLQEFDRLIIALLFGETAHARAAVFADAVPLLQRLRAGYVGETT